MMERIPEPELMDDPEQAAAYARADFSEAHDRFVALFREHFGYGTWEGPVLDLGCGAADITIRFAKVFEDVEILGVDGAESMLSLGRQAVVREGLERRITLLKCYLPTEHPPAAAYGAVISNSLLHHLSDPSVLWSAIRRFAAPGAPVLVMDLERPETPQRAAELVDRYAAGEAEILRRDFYHSLRAAYRPDEAARQIREAGLGSLHLESVSDRHWIARGRM